MWAALGAGLGLVADEHVGDGLHTPLRHKLGDLPARDEVGGHAACSVLEHCHLEAFLCGAILGDAGRDAAGGVLHGLWVLSVVDAAHTEDGHAVACVTRKAVDLRTADTAKRVV